MIAAQHLDSLCLSGQKGWDRQDIWIQQMEGRLELAQNKGDG